MESPRWHICATAAELCEQAVAWIAAEAREAITARGVFRLVLAGGETPRKVYERLCVLDTDWGAWEIWFGDERCLPAGSAGRNSRMAMEAWLERVPIPTKRVHVIRAELGPEAAAAGCRADLVGVSEFDLVLLGLGEDGHTASLFPGGKWNEDADTSDALAVCDAPKPPAERVSMGARRLSRTRGVLFLVAGADKRSAVAAWRSGDRLPAAAIQPRGGVDVLVERICLEG